MKELHTTFGEKLEILLFPSDEFGKQEVPEAQIPAFVDKQGLPISAPGCHLMAKANTNGAEESAVYTLAKSVFPGKITWNFGAIFLFDKEGKPAAKKSLRDLQSTDIEKLL